MDCLKGLFDFMDCLKIEIMHSVYKIYLFLVENVK